MGPFRSLPATTCPTTLTPCWRCMACGTHRHVKGRVDVCPNRAVTPPPDLCYAVVVKERVHGRVVHVTTRLVYGTTEQVETALRMSPVSRTITTYGVERQNLTVRQHSS